jgi:hypothetical protein
MRRLPQLVLRSKGEKETLKITDWWLPPPADSINIRVQEIISLKIHLEEKMTRTLLAMMFTMSLFFVTGCSSSTETTLIEAPAEPQISQAEEENYDEQMDEEGEGDE